MLTAPVTLLVGVLIFVVGQLIVRFVIDPIHEQKKTIGEIADALIFYADIWANLGPAEDERTKTASRRFRELAALLQSRTYMIPRYGFLEWIRFVRPASLVKQARANLIGLSNGVFENPGGNGNRTDRMANEKRVKEIKEWLQIWDG